MKLFHLGGFLFYSFLAGNKLKKQTIMIKTILSYINGFIAGGLLVQQFYIWFLLPVFKNMPQITYLEAVGLGTFLYLFNRIQAVDLVFHKKYEEEHLVKYGSFLMPWIVLLFGFITHLILEVLK